jgi:hypothetical protein
MQRVAIVGRACKEEKRRQGGAAEQREELHRRTVLRQARTNPFLRKQKRLMPRSGEVPQGDVMSRLDGAPDHACTRKFFAFFEK